MINNQYIGLVFWGSRNNKLFNTRNAVPYRPFFLAGLVGYGHNLEVAFGPILGHHCQYSMMMMMMMTIFQRGDHDDDNEDDDDDG